MNNQTHAWKPTLNHYDELVAVEFNSQESFSKSRKYLVMSRELRTCPQESVPVFLVLIIPKEAVQFLPLKGIPYTITDVRSSMFVEKDVLREVDMRFNEDPLGSHYYRSSNDACCLKNYVPLSTIRSIEAELSKKPPEK